VDSTHDFLSQTRRIYVDANKATLRWMLERPTLSGGFLNTKLNSISLKDYSHEDAWRGPDYLYGWIQGRGLEALVTHAAFFEHEDPDLARKLDGAARALYAALGSLYDRYGAAYFLYDKAGVPIYRGADGQAVPQVTGSGYFTYADAFVIKGLIAAAQRYDRNSSARYLEKMAELDAAIEDNRFIMDESRGLDQDALSKQKAEFGPRMIVLGAAAMLRHLGLEDASAFGERYIEHILQRHWDNSGDSPSGLLLDAVGGDHSNAGHAIEFAGFALDYLPSTAPENLVLDLERVLAASFQSAFAGPGIRLSISAVTGAPLSPYFPWWSLPETVRAAALGYSRTGNEATLDIWQQAHTAFFANFWRDTPAIAYQTRDASGPVDHVPATPDLDPGYHTGLSFLGAIEAIDRIAGDQTT
jgi:hypothetical protein